MKIGITSDCSSGLEYAPFPTKVKITRTTIYFKDQQYVDGIDIKAKEFYQKIRETGIVPTTAAPTPGEIIRCAEEWKNEGCTDVIHFPISYNLSTYGENLSKNADDYVEGVKLHVFNCHSACLMEGYCAHYAEILAEKGYTVDEILAECQTFADQTFAYFLVDDLQYLVKNGRLNAVSGAIGALLKVKPILYLGKPGTIDVAEKVRTHHKALDRVFDLVKEKTKDAKKVLYLILCEDNTDQSKGTLCRDMIERAQSMYKNNALRIESTTIVPTIGAHIGYGVVGIGAIILDNLKESI
jgi:DegV family protein with EDD domain